MTSVHRVPANPIAPSSRAQAGDSANSTSAPQGSIAGRSGVNSFTRPATPARIASIFTRSSADSSSFSAGVVRVHLGGRARADQRGAHRGVTEHPRQRDLAHGSPRGSATSLTQALDHADVGLEIVAAEDRLAEGHAVAAPVTRGIEGRRRRERAVSRP